MAEIKINMDSLKSYRKTVRHKIQEGDNIRRMLPPFGDNCDGYPYAFWAISWGLCDPSTGNRRPYADCKQAEGKSPIWEYLDLLRAQIDKLKMELVAAGKSEEEIKDRLKATNRFISDLRPKTVFAWNSIDKAGTVGIQELKTTAHKQLLKLMNQYIMDYNQDPTSLGSEATDSGVWFNISRTGQNFDTEYSVKKNQVMVKDPTTGIPSYTDDRSPIPEAVATDYNNMGYDLTAIYQKKSYDELRDILVKNLEIYTQENPDLYVEEFAVATGEKNIGVAAPDTTVASAKPQGTKSVGLKIDNPVDEKEYQTPIPKAAASSSDDDAEELMKMAEDIFNQ